MENTSVVQAYAVGVCYPQTKITISFNKGEENQLASRWKDKTDYFHDLFSDELIRTGLSAFSLYPLKEGIRDKAHALSTHILALDFDDPHCNIEQVRTFFRYCEYVLYTTRNHGKLKNHRIGDRFRIVLPVDRPIPPQDLSSIVNSFVEMFKCDPVCKDGARFFYFSTTDAAIIRNRNTGLVLSRDWLLSIQCPMKGHSYAGAKDRIETFALKQKEPHAKHTSFLRKAWPNVRNKHEDTYLAIYALMFLWIESFGTDLAALKAALLKVQEIEEFYARKPHQWYQIDQTLFKALDYMSNNTGTLLDCKNKVSKININDIPLSTKAPKAASLATTVCSSSDFVEDAILVEHALTQFKRAIIDLPCGRGKTLLASGFVSLDTSKWIIVKKTLDDCKAQEELLVKYGIPESSLVVVSGWDADECFSKQQQPSDPSADDADDLESSKHTQSESKDFETDWRVYYARKTSPCLSCLQNNCSFKLSRTQSGMRSILDKKRVVIVTHERFFEMAYTYSDSLSGFRILIDEEPAVFESLAFEPKDIKRLRRMLGSCLDGKVENMFVRLLSSNSRGTISVPEWFDELEIKSLKGKCTETCFPDLVETAYKFIHFMSREAPRYAMVEGDTLNEKKITFSRDRLTFDLPNDIYILSASAQFSMVEWPGFTVVTPKNQKAAEGITIHGIQGNSTKHKLDQVAKTYLEQALEVIKKNNRKHVLLAVNKETTRTDQINEAVNWFTSECARINATVSKAERGSIIGRNNWRDSDCVIMAYGLFTSVANVALKCSLSKKEEIRENTIWSIKQVNGIEAKQPKMKKGLEDPDLQNIERRIFTDELYQVGMRGVARNWNNDQMDIITLAPSIKYLLPIRQVLAGCNIIFEGLDLSKIAVSDLLANDAKLCSVFDLSDNSANKKLSRELAYQLLPDHFLAVKAS